MKQLADGVWQLRGFPPNGINVYLVEDVLIDAATRRAGRRILKQLAGHDVRAHALTHAHADHQGASDEVCGRLGIPYWVGEKDVPFAEEPRRIADVQPQHRFNRLAMEHWVGPGRTVDRALREGDEVAGFEVIDVPGHSPGHVAYWRESDRVLILGDVLNNVNVVTGVPGLHDPKWYFTADPDENRRSAKKLAPLEPKLMLFGHGAPLRDTRRFVQFVDGLAA
ncbi:MAG TPA: MBL fold metallo-hydrolase [Thermoleophilaceae bacterium]|nr:MBL fold metallo-hydrolase [Thermoleophilaceae bacterium]